MTVTLPPEVDGSPRFKGFGEVASHSWKQGGGSSDLDTPIEVQKGEAATIVSSAASWRWS